MKREHLQLSYIVIPEPYVECPFTNSADDIKGHLSWTNAVNLSYSSNGASFNGSSSYLRCRNQLKLEKIKTVSYLVKFNRIPTDGVSSTWMALHYFMSYSYYNYAAYYSIFQHYSNENVDLTNNARTNSYSIADNTLTTPFGSALTGVWYRITFRRNSNNTTDLWIDELHRVVNYAIPDSYYSDIVFGKLYPNNIRYLDGNIKDFRIWDVELTDEQISDLQHETPTLPSGYLRLDHIESTGTQYINTGIRPTKNVIVDLDFQMTNLSTSSIIGQTYYTYNTFRFLIDVTSSQFDLATGSVMNPPASDFHHTRITSDLNRHRWQAWNGGDIFDGNETSHPIIETNLSSLPIYIFCRNDGNASYKCKMKLYRCKIKDTGVQVDYIPALRIADSKPGLYDLVNNQFYTNSGIGEFLYN